PAALRTASGSTTASAPDTLSLHDALPISPTVAITSPSGGATVSGTVTVTATATDNVGVAGVRFFVDGAALGTEDTSAPYSRAWDDPKTASRNTSPVRAAAADAGGNTTTSA